MLGRTDSRARLFLLLLAVIVAGSGMIARLAWWQIGQSDAVSNQVAQNHVHTQTIPTRRGTIYDRTGKVVLAQTIDMYRIIGDPHDMDAEEKSQALAALADYLNLDGPDVARIQARLEGKTYYSVLATEVDASVAQQLMMYQQGGGLSGISFELEPVRVYPQAGGAPGTSLAAQLLGFVNAAGKGQYGIEQHYDGVLAGRPEVVQIDPGISGPNSTKVIDAGQPGQDIRCSIDATLQLEVENEVFATWVADKARTVSAMVMDPNTGEMLAEASYPSYDANNYSVTADANPDLFLDPVVTRMYEPGSVFKMLTASAALQTRTTLLTTKINDTGVLKMPGGQEVADADRRAKGWMSFGDIVAWSRNVGAAQAAFRLGRSTPDASRALYQTWQQYGIGQLTGIDVTGEVKGQVRNPWMDNWAKMDLANASFGQGVAVTPIQVLRAYAAMSNGGTLVTPRAVIPDNGVGKGAATGTSSQGKQAISPGLSSSLTGLMQHVVTAVPSYAQRTYIKGYYIGGKTGTAQIWDQAKGDWKANDYNYSFFGWIGHDSPDIAVGIVIFEGTPTLIKQGVLDMPVQSYELFRRIATDSVLAMHIPANPNGPAAPGHRKATPQG